jgi:eukaryotic-like serine/threonine-protein kinase
MKEAAWGGPEASDPGGARPGEGGLSDVEPELGEDPDEIALLRAVASAPSAEAGGLLPGERVGRYAITGRLGRGGCGLVLSARDTLLGREVALKALSREPDERSRRRLLREARAAAAVRSPHVVTLLDVIEQDRRVWLAMDLVSGPSLRSLIQGAREGRPLSLQDALRLGSHVARAVQAVHEAQLVHRDVKPENVVVAPGPRAMLVDFGLAGGPALRGGMGGLPQRVSTGGDEPLCATSFGTEGTLRGGTPGYMSQQQQGGGEAAASDDVWSLGVLLGELGEAVRGGVAGAKTGELEAELGLVVALCTSQEREDRPSALDVARDLEALLHRAQPRGSAQGPRGRGRRAALIGAAVLVSLVLVAVASGRWRQRQGPSAARGEAEAGALPAVVRGHEAVACPPLRVVGVAGDTGWLGAAAASLLCRQVRAWRGGEASAVRVPAQLLDLPAHPSEEIPPDPFGGEAFHRAHAAAVGHGTWIDGSLTAEDEGYSLRLALHTASAPERPLEVVARGALHQVAHEAVRELVRRGDLVAAEQLAPGVRRWEGLSRPETMALLDRWWASTLSGVGVEEAEAALALRQEELGPTWPAIQARTSRLASRPRAVVEPWPVDRTSDEAFVATASIRGALAAPGPGAWLAGHAREAGERASRAQGAEPGAGAALRRVEAELLAQSGDAEQARTRLLAVIAADPATRAWALLIPLAHGRAGFATTGRAYAAWSPEAPDAQNIAALGERSDPGLRLEHARRAWILGPEIALFGANLGRGYLLEDRMEDARFLASRLLRGGPASRRAAERLLGEIEIRERRLEAAAERFERALELPGNFGNSEDADGVMLAFALELARVRGDAARVAAAFVDRFVLAVPPRLEPTGLTAVDAAHACAHADPPRARRCIARLQGLVDHGFFRDGMGAPERAFLDGARQYILGDTSAAAEAWARLPGEPGVSTASLRACAMLLAEKPEAAALIDERELERGLLGAPNLSHLRAAWREAERGELGAARARVDSFIRSWERSDRPPPSLAWARGLARWLDAAGKPDPAPPRPALRGLCPR